jgi:hypothetical protein
VEHDDTAAPKTLELPVTVAGPADVGRLVNEIETIDDTLLQLGIRSGGESTKLQKTSRLMDQTVHANRLNLLKKPDRTALREFLVDVKKRAPVLHISFSADPGPDFMDKLVAWLRAEIHPSVLITIGLQPNIGAGCIVRTTNKQFDFSLRQDFAGKRGLLLEKIAAPRPQAQTQAQARREGTPA